MTPESSLGNALTSTEATIAAPPVVAQPESNAPIVESAPATVTPITDPPAEATQETKTEETPAEKTPEQIAQARKDQDFNELRQHRETLVKENTEFRQKLDGYGGEATLNIMQPFLKVAAEMPRTEPELDDWQNKAWTTLKGTLLPAQVSALQTQATAEYTASPAGQREILRQLFGNGGEVPAELPKAIAEFAAAYIANPYVIDLIRPDETEDARVIRETTEAREKLRDEEIARLTADNTKRDTEAQKQQSVQVMTRAAEVGFAPRAEIKKQFGLEFHQNGDTPEISAFKKEASDDYDEMVTLRLLNDPQLNQLWTAAEYLANQKDESQRQRAIAQYAPQIQERTRAVCSQVGQRLANRLKLLSPGLSDQARVKDLKNLPANITGGGTTASVSNGFDLSDMPDPTTNPRGHAAWVAKKMAEDASRRNTPAILQAG